MPLWGLPLTYVPLSCPSRHLLPHSVQTTSTESSILCDTSLGAPVVASCILWGSLNSLGTPMWTGPMTVSIVVQFQGMLSCMLGGPFPGHQNNRPQLPHLRHTWNISWQPRPQRSWSGCADFFASSMRVCLGRPDCTLTIVSPTSLPITPSIMLQQSMSMSGTILLGSALPMALLTSSS